VLTVENSPRGSRLVMVTSLGHRQVNAGAIVKERISTLERRKWGKMHYDNP
jgi:hypothetical protein